MVGPAISTMHVSAPARSVNVRRGRRAGGQLLSEDELACRRATPLADIDEFSGRLLALKDTVADDLVLVARIEAFIAGHGIDEAILRAQAYAGAGADAIVIHSKGRCGRDPFVRKRLAEQVAGRERSNEILSNAGLRIS